MAIKLLDVAGTPAIPGADNRCQDFLAINHLSSRSQRRLNS